MKKKSCLLILLLFSYCSFSQVGIGTTDPDPSSILDIESDSQGILVPRLTTIQINAIDDPATGLIVYNTDMNEFQFNCSDPAMPDWSKISHTSSVKYSNTNTTTNINPTNYTNMPIFGSLDWNDDTTLYNQSGNTITVNTTGRYRISVNIAYTVPAVAGNNSEQRVSVEAQLAINGSPTGAIGNTGYVRRANGQNEASLHITEVFNITAGQTISVQTIRGGNTAPAYLRSAGTSNIYIEKIK
ncbi:hypothetical protein GCM10023311_08660 [Flaviramulus aquimarinus]|uniref:C1q domain-containing protein n=1 Tax=Flaviramulus aquimarinus TaxID=1170456 RepID=A0ABP9EUE1_9FLAO